MLRRRALVAATAAVAVGALGLAGLSGVASADPQGATAPAADRLSPGLLEAMRRDLGLGADEAKARIADEYRAAAVARGLEKSLGADFAGARVSGPEAVLTVATTDRADVAEITAAGARAEVVGHSLGRLDAAKAALDAVALKKAPKDVPSWYVDVRTNRLVVNAARTAAADRLLDAAGVSRALVRVVHSTEQPRTYADLRGGDAYYMNGSGRCSIGFPVKRGTQNGFVSAGHCGTPGVTTSGVNQQAQGSFQGSTFPGRDYSWVAVNANWTPRALVNGYGNGDVTVAGSTQAVVGSSVCRSGSTTGWHCGTIQQHDTSVTYQEGTVSGVTRTGVCAEPGDSGGSFISGSQAQGVTSGGSGNCSQGGTTYYQPINPALSAYGLTLVTSGTPTDPPTGPPTGEPGGTWAVGTTYAAGAVVTYGGASYRCLQGHQAQAGWTPPDVPALWQRI
ncbi:MULTISPECIES: alpha-lytic protease prodomain-containing protein [unclassified Streptomyces]|uniref:alpha-lytic protease prodomain-containing protein n=1 Tax=unclassified Streptomyces TaxID=2593676 RepID=UPI0001C1C6A9|nr:MULTISPECIES: alpha-lytic protease prodomain-containing protein [unclassified Streptomyces]AEN10749.1 peptidase alpha-lytic pro domain protein [Streptomyces sp. SirexAA-E]MYR65426.1 trypsin-like serine protease [Streptomyces sp. SID4939]MYS01419.1 trypsin-like serine protease [Streptomyces sp. SID4940]MYT62549.1 trypsin-like serine protease [Streptomyces sp. SID8357]MYT89357.1 trypsin-like serine protease [Streptomyces sp. SID8360]